MSISRARLYRYVIPLKKLSGPTRHLSGDRRGLIVELTDEAGRTGLGEIAPLLKFSLESLDEAESAARQACASLVSGSSARPADWLAYPPSSRFGLDTALHDLAARKSKQPLARQVVDNPRSQVAVNSLLPLGPTPDRILQKLCDPGFSILKVKTGYRSPENDNKSLKYLTGRIPPWIQLRLDANSAWTPQEAKVALEGLPPDRIDFVEEPLAPWHSDSLNWLHETCGLRFALDETVVDPERWNALLRCEAICAVVLKPTLVGDLDEVAQLAERARSLGRRVVVTSTLESGVGVTACLHVAAAVATTASDGTTIPCGLDTLHLIDETLLVSEPLNANGVMTLPTEPGLGIELDRKSSCLEIIAEFSGDRDD